ncbi:hypothetical protein [Tanticharoenia sakaeratensis]|uniref:Uncharacterized protein n=1 Tax=Tanticharoenia sakaeratensis NBRC 103193 TaxID=1231623 RepID=A0A0D6MJV3_9PROT|nr:hypothetical protein [Tanticharoenia sakaeratensis]GAN53907.1 hypothetical protein Tasa_012_083 [Tanticharoenia sakaeratensis NBRC 103193]GBQ25234.1 hypothetical protein AA103193_3014 [Tanticharoenia sakaeratensis NBRC 103193]
MLAGLLALPAHALARAAWPADDGAPSYADDATVGGPPALLVGGSADTGPAQLAGVLAQPLARSLGTAGTLGIRQDAGQDGVTAANQFDTSTEAEVASALLIPGAALIAALTGDQRVHFDYSRWVSVMVAQTPVVTITRNELHRTLRARIAGAFHDHPVRIGVSRATGVELASVLGLSLLGLHSVPVQGFAEPAQAIAALNDGTVDAIQLSPDPGEDLRGLIGRLPTGSAPLFSFGAGNASTVAPGFAETYMAQRQRTPGGPLYQAWCAVAAGAAIDSALVLPMLTPPTTVARWRRAAVLATEDNRVRDWTAHAQLTLNAGDNSAAALAALTPNLTAVLALRRWLALNEPRWRMRQETRPI